jgi:hypothetical protein
MPSSKYPQVYEDEDGEAFAAIEDEPDMASCAQRYADQTGMLVGFLDRTYSDTQECECVPTSDHCPDDEGMPCRVRRHMEGWRFATAETPDDLDIGAFDPADVFYPHDDAGRTLILGHRYATDDYHHNPKFGHPCTATEQEHYRERIEAPGQTEAFEVGSSDVNH